MATDVTDFSNWVQDLRKKKNNIPRFIKSVVDGKGGIWVLMPLKQRLFNQGTDGNGVKLAPYSAGYQKRKQAKTGRSNPTSLRYDGDFYKSMFVKTSAKGLIEVDASDSKTNKLIEKYGEEILGLTDEQEQVLADKLAVAIVDYVFEKESPLIELI